MAFLRIVILIVAIPLMLVELGFGVAVFFPVEILYVASYSLVLVLVVTCLCFVYEKVTSDVLLSFVQALFGIFYCGVWCYFAYLLLHENPWKFHIGHLSLIIAIAGLALSFLAAKKRYKMLEQE